MIRLLLLGIVCWAFVIRFLHFWALSGTAYLKIPFIFPESDLYAFWQWAETILAGDFLGRDTYHPYVEWMQAIAPLETWYRWWGGKEIFQQAPFYPYWVAGLLAMSGNSFEFVILVQLLLGALHPLVVFALARRLFDFRVGLVAAALTAFYGPFVFHQGTLLRDWLPPLVEPLVLLAFLRARASCRVPDWLLAGAALGLALLIKPTILLFIPLALLWIFLEYRGASRRIASSCAVLILGILLSLSPLIVRNVSVGAPFFALSNRAAEAFIESNAADAFPIGFYAPPSMKGILARSDGRLLSVAWETLRTYQGDWLRFAKLQLTKFRALVDPLEVPNNLNFYYGLEISPALRFTLRYGVIFPLGVAGFLLSFRSGRQHRLLAFYLLSSVVGLMVGIMVARYRLVLLPVLIIYGAAGLVWLVQRLQMRHTAQGLAYLGLIFGLAVTQHVLLPLPMLRDNHTIVVHHPEYVLSARIYASERQFERAVAEIERLKVKMKGRPSFANRGPQVPLYEGGFRGLWAMQLSTQGKRQAAKRQAELAVAAYRHYPQLSYPYNNLGLVYLSLNEPARAKAYFRRFLELEPEGPTAEVVKRRLSRLEGSPPLGLFPLL